MYKFYYKVYKINHLGLKYVGNKILLNTLKYCNVFRNFIVYFTANEYWHYKLNEICFDGMQRHKLRAFIRNLYLYHSLSGFIGMDVLVFYCVFLFFIFIGSFFPIFIMVLKLYALYILN